MRAWNSDVRRCTETDLRRRRLEGEKHVYTEMPINYVFINKLWTREESFWLFLFTKCFQCTTWKCWLLLFADSILIGDFIVRRENPHVEWNRHDSEAWRFPFEERHRQSDFRRVSHRTGVGWNVLIRFVLWDGEKEEEKSHKMKYSWDCKKWNSWEFSFFHSPRSFVVRISEIIGILSFLGVIFEHGPMGFWIRLVLILILKWHRIVMWTWFYRYHDDCEKGQESCSNFELIPVSKKTRKVLIYSARHSLFKFHLCHQKNIHYFGFEKLNTKIWISNFFCMSRRTGSPGQIFS